MGSVGSDSSGTSETGATGNFMIGRRSYENSAHLKGLVAIVQVWNRGLSLKEIQQNFDAQRSRFGV